MTSPLKLPLASAASSACAFSCSARTASPRIMARRTVAVCASPTASSFSWARLFSRATACSASDSRPISDRVSGANELEPRRRRDARRQYDAAHVGVPGDEIERELGRVEDAPQIAGDVRGAQHEARPELQRHVAAAVGELHGRRGVIGRGADIAGGVEAVESVSGQQVGPRGVATGALHDRVALAKQLRHLRLRRADPPPGAEHLDTGERPQLLLLGRLWQAVRQRPDLAPVLEAGARARHAGLLRRDPAPARGASMSPAPSRWCAKSPAASSRPSPHVQLFSSSSATRRVDRRALLAELGAVGDLLRQRMLEGVLGSGRRLLVEELGAAQRGAAPPASSSSRQLDDLASTPRRTPCRSRPPSAARSCRARAAVDARREHRLHGRRDHDVLDRSRPAGKRRVALRLPASTSARTTSSMKNGLPAVRSWMRAGRPRQHGSVAEKIARAARRSPPARAAPAPSVGSRLAASTRALVLGPEVRAAAARVSRHAVDAWPGTRRSHRRSSAGPRSAIDRALAAPRA